PLAADRRARGARGGGWAGATGSRRPVRCGRRRLRSVPRSCRNTWSCQRRWDRADQPPRRWRPRAKRRGRRYAPCNACEVAPPTACSFRWRQISGRLERQRRGALGRTFVLRHGSLVLVLRGSAFVLGSRVVLLFLALGLERPAHARTQRRVARARRLRVRPTFGGEILGRGAVRNV